MHASTIAEMLVKIGSVSLVVEIFGEIGRFLPYNFFHLTLWNH